MCETRKQSWSKKLLGVSEREREEEDEAKQRREGEEEESKPLGFNCFVFLFDCFRECDGSSQFDPDPDPITRTRINVHALSSFLT